jgi:excisionase family DNA binding protein
VTGRADGGRFLTAAEVADLLGMTGRNSVGRLVRTGKLGAFRIGRQYRVRESDALAYLRAHPLRNGQVWREIAVDLRKLAVDLPPGDKLPGPTALAGRYGTSTGPPTKALLRLRDEGLVYLVPYTGFYVSDGTAAAAG